MFNEEEIIAENEAFDCDDEVCPCESEEPLDDFQVLLHETFRELHASVMSTSRAVSMLETMQEMYNELPDNEEFSVYPDPDELPNIYRSTTLFRAFLKSLFV